MEQDLQFYQDLLYNPHASEYNELIANVVVHTWKVWGRLTGRRSIFARRFLVRHSLGKKWWEVKYKGGRRVLARDTAFHQIKLLVPYPRSWFNDTLHARHWCFKMIRARVCRQWLARVRVHIGRADWCNDLVAGIVCNQLEAWFVRVPHADVRW